MSPAIPPRVPSAPGNATSGTPGAPDAPGVHGAIVELVVLLDDHGNAIGTAPKHEVHHAETPLHLAFSTYLFDGAGSLLMTRRAAGKLTFPGVWTNSVCGHPLPGETMIDAVRRRARDELGAAPTRLRLALPRFAYRASMNGIVEHEMCPVYTGEVDRSTPLRPDPAEAAEVAWVPWAEVVKTAADTPTALSPWCAEQVGLLAALGPDPAAWPVGRADQLPAAAVAG